MLLHKEKFWIVCTGTITNLLKFLEQTKRHIKTQRPGTTPDKWMKLIQYVGHIFKVIMSN